VCVCEREGGREKESVSVWRLPFTFCLVHACMCECVCVCVYLCLCVSFYIRSLSACTKSIFKEIGLFCTKNKEISLFCTKNMPLFTEKRQSSLITCLVLRNVCRT